LLYHESDLRIEEHYTDTAGFTDHVFALCHLRGFRFAPRIRDLADKRLYVSDPDREYGTLAPIAIVSGLIAGRRVHACARFPVRSEKVVDAGFRSGPDEHPAFAGRVSDDREKADRRKYPL